MKKAVLQLELYDDKAKQKAMKIVSGLEGVDSIAMDMKDKKLTVVGDIDPVTVARKLRKLCRTEILSVGPAKAEAEKKKEEAKKPEEKKKDDVAELIKAYQAYPNYMSTQYYYRSMEENPNACVIC